MIIFFLLFCLFSPTISWDPDVIKLRDSEIAAISAKCNRKSANEQPEVQPTNVSKKDAAPAGLYPFMAFVGKNDQFLCGAVFVSPRHLLTVRACLRESNGHGLSLHVGGQCYGENSGRCSGKADMKMLEIESAIYDDQEWGTDTRDLAILQISDALAETVAPIIDIVCLPTKDNLFPTSAVVVGWGHMEQSSSAKHIQHSPIALRSANSDGNFVGIITVPQEERLKSEHGDKSRVLPTLGLNSSTGNAVVSFSTTNGHYVLHGLLLGTSWSGRSGKTVSDGLKIAYFHADLCHELRLCAPGINRVSTIPKLKMLSGYSKTDGGSIAGYGFPGGYGEERFTGDGRYCHMETTGDLSLTNETEVTKLVWYNAAGEYINIDGSVNQSEIISFDLGNAWKLTNEQWYHQAKHPQLSLRVCMAVNPAKPCPKGLLFCWRNGFGKGSLEADNPYINAMCNPHPSEDQFWNGMLITFDHYDIKHPPKFNLSFMHSKSEKLIEVKELPDQCWHFRFIKWHENMMTYNFGIYAKENPSFLPFLELDDDVDPHYPHNLDKIKMKVVGSEGCGLLATLRSEYGTPRYFKWVPSKQGSCGNEHGVNPLHCVENQVVTSRRTVNNWDSDKGATTNEQIKEEEEIKSEVSKTVDNVVKKNVDDFVKETTSDFKASILASIKAGKFGFSAELEASVTKEMSEKMSSKTAKAMTNSLRKAATNKIMKKLQTVKTLKVVKQTIVQKYEEVSTKVEQGSEASYDLEAGVYEETCQQQRVAYGIDEVKQITGKYNKESFHPKRDDRFT